MEKVFNNYGHMQEEAQEMLLQATAVERIFIFLEETVESADVMILQIEENIKQSQWEKIQTEKKKTIEGIESEKFWRLHTATETVRKVLCAANHTDKSHSIDFSLNCTDDKSYFLSSMIEGSIISCQDYFHAGYLHLVDRNKIMNLSSS